MQEGRFLAGLDIYSDFPWQPLLELESAPGGSAQSWEKDRGALACNRNVSGWSKRLRL